MLTFESRYPCPVRLIHGGGVGKYGLCAMELLSVMAGGCQEDGIRPNEWVSSVDEDLRNLVVRVNDTTAFWSTPEQRADLLWPILPKVLGTKGNGPAPFPRETYADRLGVPIPGTPVGALLMFERLHGEDMGSYQEAALHALKEGISLYWETWGGTPQEDYTDEQYGRLTRWLSAQEGNVFLERMVYSAA